MRTIVVGDEKNLAALRKRILDPGVTGSARKGIDEELRAANPHLDLDKLSPGAVVVVPDLPGVSAPPAGRPATTVLPGRDLAGTGADRSGAWARPGRSTSARPARSWPSSSARRQLSQGDQGRRPAARRGDPAGRRAIAEEQRAARAVAGGPRPPRYRPGSAALDALRDDGSPFASRFHRVGPQGTHEEGDGHGTAGTGAHGGAGGDREADTTLTDAARLMRDADIGDVIVVDRMKPIGVLTDRDIVVRGIADNRMPGTVTAGEICSTDVVTVAPDAEIVAGDRADAPGGGAPAAGDRGAAS